jgi:uncharacterized protein (TIGR02246 family)
MTSRTFQRLICLAVLLLGAQSIFAQSQDNMENQTMENAKIHSTIETNNAAVSAGDIEGILATFEPNAVLMAQPGMPAMGTPALREAFKQFTALAPKITITGYEVIQAGDIAVHQSTWKMSGKAPDGKAFEQNGFSVVVLRKQPDGRWLMVIDNPFGDGLLQKK